MNKFNQRFLHASGVFFLLTAAQPPVLADDTDIFLGNTQNALALKPNILFIMDDSGSMDDLINITVSNYNPNTTYPATYSNNNLYYVFNGPTFVGVIPKADFTCQDVMDEIAADDAGYANLAEQVGASISMGVRNWDDPIFDDLTSYQDASGTNIPATNFRVECQEDQGKHGETASSTDVYASLHGWQSSATGAFNWNSAKSQPYTVATMNWANWKKDPTAATNVNIARFTVLQNVLRDLVGDLDDVNIGLMAFRDSQHGGQIHMPITEINANNGSARAEFIAALDALPNKYCQQSNCSGQQSPTYVANWFPKLSSWTPLTETLYEAMLYFGGKQAKFSGLTSTPASGRSHPNAFVSAGSNVFKSPMTDACQPNFAILLTDGEPTQDLEVNNDIPPLSGTNCSAGYSNNHGKCIDDLAGYMSGNDSNAFGIDWSATDLNTILDGKQRVKVYPIGFTNPNLKVLIDSIAAMADTKPYTASDADTLKTAFNDILTQALETETTFVAPAVSVNTSNQLSHSDSVYYALFRPSEYSRWNGNLKKYKIKIEAESATDPTLVVKIKDLDGNLAIENGEIKSNSKNLWADASDAPDGASIVEGGFAKELTASRTIYTYTGSNPNLNHTSNSVSKGNTVITNLLMGIGTQPDNTYRDTLLDWATGKDVQDADGDNSTSDANHFVGDPMHSKPVVVSYDAANSNPDSVLFFGDNLGMLHAVDTDDGKELWAFMPTELLPNIDTYFQNDVSVQKTYGLDGPITAWVNDINGDGDVQDANEFIYLFVGMRRGGRDYYVLDVTNKDQPKFKYQISGGQPPVPANATPAPDFHELAQSWSAPKLAKVRWGCDATTGCDAADYKEVVFFAGGYDPNQDSTVLTGPDTMGRAIYMIDPHTGAKLWSAGYNGSAETHDFTHVEMKHSLAADLAVIDLDGDGFHEAVFATDIMGQVWRFDFDKEYTGSGDLHLGGGIIADLQRKTTVSGVDYHHRYFNTPDVAFFNQTGKPAHVTISLGSGYRASPLLTDMQDRFYSFKDYNVFYPPSSYDYYNVLDTNFSITSSRTLTGNDLGDAEGINQDYTYGWYRNLALAGEKSLSRSITFNNEVVFTTFSPTPQGAALCSGDFGIAQSYFVSAANGRATRNLDTSDDSTALGANNNNAFKRLAASTGIPPEPSVIFVGTSKQVTKTDANGVSVTETYTENEAALCVGLSCEKAELEPVNKSFWRVNE